MTTEPKPERKKLSVTEVKEVQKVGDKKIPKLVFKAKDGEHELQFFIIARESLFEHVKVGATIDADVLTTRRESDDPERPWIDRKVTSIYVEGQAVGGGSKSGWRPAEDSPEKRASIEAQSAVQAVVQLRIADKLTDLAPAYIAALEWCTSRIRPSKQAPVVSTPASEPQKAVASPLPGLSGEEIAEPDDVTMLVAALIEKFNWKDEITAEKYIVQQLKHGLPYSKADLVKVRRAAHLEVAG